MEYQKQPPQSVLPQEQICPGREQLRQVLGNKPYLAHRTTFKVGNLPVHCEFYKYSSRAPVILFLPGIGTYAELYAEMLYQISENGFNVIAVDLPGHGYSGGKRGIYTVDTVTESISRVIDTLVPHTPGPIGIYGYSIGALLAVATAEQEERIKAVLCGTLLATEIPPDIFHFFGWQWTESSAVLFPYEKLPLSLIVNYDRLLANHPASKLITQDPMLILDYPFKTLASLFGHKAGIMRRTFPFKMAIVHGDEDEVLPLDYSRRVISQAKQPIELICIPEGKHMIPLLAPGVMADIVANWFANTL